MEFLENSSLTDQHHPLELSAAEELFQIPCERLPKTSKNCSSCHDPHLIYKVNHTLLPQEVIPKGGMSLALDLSIFPAILGLV